MEGYLVFAGNGRGNRYFYNTLEEALNDKHKHWAIYGVEKIGDDNFIIYNMIRGLKERTSK